MGKKNQDKKKKTKNDSLKDVNVNTEAKKRTITTEPDKLER